MLLIHARFHIDSEVEINAATENAYKAVLFKKKGFEPALMPPRISKGDLTNKLMEEGFEEYLFSDDWTALLERDVRKGKQSVDVLNEHKSVESLKKNGINFS